MRKIDAPDKRVVGIWQIVSAVFLFVTILLTAFMIVFVVLDNIFDVYTYGTFMFEFFDRFIAPSAMTIFWLPAVFCSLGDEYIELSVVVAVICGFAISVILYFTFGIFKEKAKIVVRTWIVIMVFESLISFACIFAEVFCIFIFAFRAFTVFSLFMSLRFIDKHYEYYDL